MDELEELEQFKQMFTANTRVVVNRRDGADRKAAMLDILHIFPDGLVLARFDRLANDSGY